MIWLGVQRRCLMVFFLTSRTDSFGATIVPVMSVIGMVVVWSGLAVVKNDPSVLPGPWVIGPMIIQELQSGDLIRHMAATLARVLAAFAIAMAAGVAIGLVMGRSRAADRWLDPWLIAFLNLPALVTIVLCYLWIGLNEAAAITAVALNKIPAVAVTMREGARALSPALDDMAGIYRMSRMSRFSHVILPQLSPYVASAGRSGIALIWKIVLVVEFLGRGEGIGFQIHLYFQLFDVAMVLTYALSFVAVMLVIETFVLRPWEARTNRWRSS